MKLLPLAPPNLRDEALSSWIARIPARYDISPYEFARHLLPAEDGYAEMVRWIDTRPAGPLEARLAEATGCSHAELSGRRLAGLTSDPSTSWPRRTPAWCARCVAQDVAKTGEVHWRREWGFGGYLICPKHDRLLSAACPRCLQQSAFHPVNGRLRLWCSACSACVDIMPELSTSRTWPPRAQPVARACRTVRLGPGARSSLLGVQAHLLAALAGGGPNGAWAHGLMQHGILGVLRKFAFVMVGPLGEERWRAAPGRARQRVEGLPADDWTPGALPPEIAATVILVCVKFLGAESDIGLSGMTWDRRVLADGEGAPINAATLLWHLTHAEGETLHQMFGHPSVQPFSALLSALSADAKRVAAAHEERRRRWMEVERRAGSRDRAGTATWKRRELASPRYAPSRFMPFNCPFRPAPLPSCTRDAAAAAVALALTTEPTNETADLSRYAGSLFGNRYIHFWLLRHLHRPPDDLINVLTQAVDVSRARDRGIILPEMPRDQMRGSVIAPDNQHLSMAD